MKIDILIAIFAIIYTASADNRRDYGYQTAHDNYNCDLSTFQQFNVEILKYRFTNPLISVRQLRDHYIRCKAKLTLNLRLAVSRIAREPKQRITQLANNVRDKTISFKNDFEFDVSETRLVEAIVAYLDLRAIRFDLKSLLNSNFDTGKEHFSMKLKNELAWICRSVYAELEPTIKIYDVIGYEDMIIGEIDEFTSEWLTFGRICNRILTDFDSIADLVYEIVYKNHYLANNNKIRDLYDEWTELQYKIFGVAAAEIEPTIMLKYLKRMEQIHKQLTEVNLLTKAEQRSWNADRRLIEYSRISDNKCTLKYFDDLRAAIGRSLQFPGTIRPYLKYFEVAQFEYCKPAFKKKLDLAKAGLSEGHRNDAGKLVDYIVSTGSEAVVQGGPRLPKITQKGLEVGSLSFIKFKTPDSKINLKNRIPENVYWKLFEDTIIEMCKTVVDQLDAPMKVFDDLILMPELGLNFDQDAKTWITVNNVCKRILKQKKELIQITYEILWAQSRGKRMRLIDILKRLFKRRERGERKKRREHRFRRHKDP